MNISKADYDNLQRQKDLYEEALVDCDSLHTRLDMIRRAARGLPLVDPGYHTGMSPGGYAELTSVAVPKLSRSERQEKREAELHERIVELESRLTSMITLTYQI